MSKHKKFQTLDVLLISLSHHIHDIYTSFLAPVQSIIIDKLSINYTLFGLLAVIQRIPNLFNPYMGILAERIRIRYFMIFAPAITAITMSLIGLAPTYSFLAVLMLVSGISSSMFHVPTPVMINHVAGNKTGKGMSFYMVGGELARTLGPIIIIGATDLWGFEGSFRLIPMGIASTIILYLRFRHVDLRKDFPYDEKRSKIYGQVFRKYLPTLLIIVGITFTRGFMKSCMTYYLPGYLKETGNSLWIQGIGLSVVYLSGTFGTLFSGTLSDHLGRKKMLLILSIVSPVLLFLFVFYGRNFTFPLLLVIGLFLLAPTPVFLSIIHNFKTDHLAFINGLYMTSNFIVSSVTTLISGFLLDKLGSAVTFRLAAFIALGAIPIVLLFNEKKE